jgi:hypothetical protein
MKFDKLVNQIIKEMLDPVDDIGPDPDPGPKGHTYMLQLKAEIEDLHDKIGYPTSNLSGMSVKQLERMVKIARETLNTQRRYEDERPY